MVKRLTLMAVLVLCLLPITAFSTGSPPQQGPYNQCVTHLAPLRAGQHVSQILGSHCYRTFAEAIAEATGGRTHLASNVRPQDLTQAMLDAVPQRGAAPQTLYALSVEFWDWHYGGASLTQYGSLPCNQVSGYSVNNLGSWNDKISSSIGYNYCDYNTHWDNSNFTGSYIICEANCYEMGSMNDRTSAIEWQY
jgi:hypothetical protein